MPNFVGANDLNYRRGCVAHVTNALWTIMGVCCQSLDILVDVIILGQLYTRERLKNLLLYNEDLKNLYTMDKVVVVAIMAVVVDCGSGKRMDTLYLSNGQVVVVAIMVVMVDSSSGKRMDTLYLSNGHVVEGHVDLWWIMILTCFIFWGLKS